jgi:hypothetical protein
MKDVTAVIQALASLLWPLFAFWFVHLFKHQIRDILTRIKKGKVLGQEIELQDSLGALETAATTAASDVATLPQGKLSPTDTAPLTSGLETIDQKVDHILHDATLSPKLALIGLSAEIERELREVLASLGQYSTRIGIREGIQTLVRLGLPQSLTVSVNLFSQMRNRLVHGYGIPDDAVVSALDSGITILKAIKAVPRETHRIYRKDVALFANDAGDVEVNGATGVILESTGADGKSSNRIYPTTKAGYEIGKPVSWEWNLSQTFGETWYRDPDTGTIRYAWTSSAEFVGRHFDQL